MNWINWLRGFSIRSRLIACMALVVVIGTIVGAGMSWRLMSLKGEFDNFAREEFTATQLKDKLEAYSKSLRPTLELIAGNALSSSAEAYQSTDTARQEADQAEALAAQLNASVVSIADARRNTVEGEVQSTIVSLCALLLSPGIIFLPLMGATVYSITRPLMRAEEITQAIAHGDLTQTIPLTGQDEIAHLMSSMKTMQDGLRDRVASVRDSSESMLTASTEIAAGNQDLSTRTEQTASNLQAAASSMDEISKTVEHSADSATVANQLASTASAPSWVARWSSAWCSTWKTSARPRARSTTSSA